MSDTQLRASQIITTFGPGAMVDFPEDSVLISGLDYWTYDVHDERPIEETRLAAKLARLLEIPTVALRSPPPASDERQSRFPNVTAWRAFSGMGGESE